MLLVIGGPDLKMMESLSYVFFVKSADTSTCHPCAARLWMMCSINLLAHIASEAEPYPTRS